MNQILYHPDQDSCERYFMIYNSFSYCTEVELSKQSFIDFVNDVGQIFEIRKFSSLGRLTYCYCPESGGAIPFAYRCMRE